MGGTFSWFLLTALISSFCDSVADLTIVVWLLNALSSSSSSLLLLLLLLACFCWKCLLFLPHWHTYICLRDLYKLHVRYRLWPNRHGFQIFFCTKTRWCFDSVFPWTFKSTLLSDWGLQHSLCKMVDVKVLWLSSIFPCNTTVKYFHCFFGIQGTVGIYQTAPVNAYWSGFIYVMTVGLQATGDCENVQQLLIHWVHLHPVQTSNPLPKPIF